MPVVTDNKSHQPLFSVIIPNYNYGRFLPRAIESVLNQSCQDFEIIVVDDGSTDDSLIVLQQYQSRISIISQENAGVSVARNKGINRSTGAYILLFDADDELFPDALDNFKQTIAEHQQAGIFIAHHYSIDIRGESSLGKPQPVFTARNKNFRDFLNRRFSIVHGGIVFKREVFNKIQYPPGITNGEDLVVFAQALALFEVVHVPYPTARIHAHGGRARNNLQAIRKVGYSTVELLFNPQILPAEFMRYKSEFMARKALSLGRAFLQGKSYSEAVAAYSLAWQNNTWVFLNFTHLIRYFKAWLSHYFLDSKY